MLKHGGKYSNHLALKDVIYVG